MGTITVGDVLSRASRQLNDDSAVRWANAELVGWYNEGLLDMVTRRAELLPVLDTFALTSGTKQDIPSNRIAIIDIGQNLGPAAKPRNGVVPKVHDKDLFDQAYPEWQYASTANIVQVVIKHQKMADSFWVFPPQPSLNPGRLSIMFSKRPGVVLLANIATEVFECDDEYIPIAVEYLLYRAFGKDAENPASGQRSAQHLQNYLGLLGAGAPQPQQG